MLDQDALEALPERIYQRLNKLNTHVLELIGARIGAIGTVSPTDAHRLAQLTQYGADIELKMCIRDRSYILCLLCLS